MGIRIYNYDKEMHGYQDDCDYVVILDKPYTMAQWDLAEKVAQKMTRSTPFHIHHEDHVIKLFCCHA